LWTSNKVVKVLTHVWSRSTVTVEESVGANPNPPFQHSLWEETRVPRENPRLSVERWPTLFTKWSQSVMYP
jgi:hypothetical protein